LLPRVGQIFRSQVLIGAQAGDEKAQSNEDFVEGQKSEVPTLELSYRILHFDYINNKGGSTSYIDNDNKNMSKSHQQFLPQKSILSALQRHSRTRSNRFLEDKVPMESLLAKGKEHYHEKRVE
jgi:hypothetical protein